MPTPQEIEAAAGIEPRDEVDRRRIWAAAQALAATEGRAPAAADLRAARRVLDAAEAAAAEPPDGGGRATITIVDAGGDDEVEVSVEFVPQLEELPGDEVAGTPAQLLALELLEGAFGEEAGGHRH